MEWITGDLLDKLTAPALLGLFFLLNMLGLIRPKRAVDEVRADRDARLAEKDAEIAYLREALGTERTRNDRLQESNHESLETVRLAYELVRGLREATGWPADGENQKGLGG